MSDIVEKLRRLAEEHYEMLDDVHLPMNEAADTIIALRAENERLKEWNREIALNAREFAAENERLRAALAEIDSISVHNGGDIHGVHPSFWEVAFKQAQDVARAALEEKPLLTARR